MQGLSKELLLRKVAPGTGTVLILGSTGTGKTHLAHEIHNASSRKQKPFISVNLGTLNENLFESELFGHEKGAFSGAYQKRLGKFEAAQGGTIFLDEIGELSLTMQTKLLDVLYNKSMTPVGSNRIINLDIRIITATNRNLEQMVKKGLFREDLYFRIKIFSTTLPDIANDFVRLKYWIDFFLQQHGKANAQIYRLSDAARRKLMERSWPGNLRELKNCLEFAVTLCEGSEIQAEDLPIYKGEIPNLASSVHDSFPLLYQDAKAKFEKAYLISVLRRNRGKINQTAKATQISKVTLIEKIRRYQIDVERIKFEIFRNSESFQSENYLTTP